MKITAFLAITGLIATTIVLASGIRSMVQGGASDLRQSTRMMMARVELQAATVFLILLALYLSFH
ncbi:MAG: hypothetical protein B7Z66_11035 [Chromatiales bacterium 21-64-14]|nr:MAG: hypothetical protein B7Z66_11035 [Chromatiales bacterium 21-64-14]HQU17265.1 twin transmembrane helix small protein [Gammaproteobacteria bacterium]